MIIASIEYAIAKASISSGEDACPRTELDSHAASIVVGKNVLILRETGKTVNVSPFTKSLGTISKVEVVDCAVAHDCPFSGETRVIIMYNALHIPEMEHNLVPPFVVRRQGNLLSDVPKIHVSDPSVDDHSLLFKDSNVRIPLQLTGTTSYFDSRAATRNEVIEAVDMDKHLDLNTDEPNWNPHDSSFARSEMNMLDFEGNMAVPEVRNRKLFEQEEMEISALEVEVVDTAVVIGETLMTDADEDHVAAALSSVSNTLDPRAFAQSLNEKVASSKFAMSVGSVSCDPDYIIGSDDVNISAMHADKPKGVSAEVLSKVFRIDLDTAKRTLQLNTQRCKRGKDPSLNRRFPSNDRMLRYKRIKEFFFMDTFYATGKAGRSTRGNTCMQIFVTDKGFTWVCPMTTESEIHSAVKRFFKLIGIPDAIICDAANAQIKGKTKKVCDEAGVTIRALEANTPWSNRAELYVGLFKKGVRRVLKEEDCPIVLWDYCAEHLSKVNNLTAKNLFQLNGQTPHMTVFGEEGDISNVCQFHFYDWCYFRDSTASFPFPDKILGRILGPADETAGNQMSQWILRADGEIFPRHTARPLTDDEIDSPIEENKRKAFNESVTRRLGNSLVPPDLKSDYASHVFDEYEDEEEKARIIPESDNDLYDSMINAEVLLPHQGKQMHATVVGPARDSDGKAKGRLNDNPILNSRVYDVMFPDGAVKQYAANIIAENMWAQVDDEGHQYMMLDEITDHRKDQSAVTKDTQYVVTKRGNQKLRQTTIGWDLCVLWKDGTQQWIGLKDLKESNPVEVAEYAKANGIDDEPAFKWWVPYTLRKRDRIISAVNQRVKKVTHKYGVRVPKSVEEAYAFDKANGNTLWRDAIAKEMANVSIAFELIEARESLAPGFKKTSCHMIFDVKLTGQLKARYVMDGHKTGEPDGSTYAGVVSRESVRIAFTYAALNGVDVMAADILNAYLQAPSTEKYYITCGLEFGLENVGKRALIVRALYGGKASGRDFRNSLRSCMGHIGFESCKADPDVWMRPATKSDGTQIYEYVLLYTDDALVVSEFGEKILREELGKYFELKEESIGTPDIYLGGKVSKVTLENGVKAYSFGSSKYVQAAVNNVADHLEKAGMKLPSRTKTPLSSNYRPEIDVSPELNATDAAYYQSLIGVLRWMVELGRIDICCEVSMMSSHLALPREGHLQQLYHMFGYLSKCHNSEIVFDPSEPDIDRNQFPRKDWEATEFGEIKEILPPGAPPARGFGFTMRAFVDADHAGDVVTRRSRTGFVVYLNNAPIYWLSKKQNSVETSSFGSEFMAMKHCLEYLRGLRYKLRMMGIPCVGNAYVYGDNQSVLYNGSLPDSTLKKKSNSIAYHFVREGCARDEWRLAYISTHDNVADLMTKPLPAGDKRMGFIRMVIHHL